MYRTTFGKYDHNYKKSWEEILFFVGILKVTEEKSSNRNRNKLVRIRGPGSVPNC